MSLGQSIYYHLSLLCGPSLMPQALVLPDKGKCLFLKVSEGWGKSYTVLKKAQLVCDLSKVAWTSVTLFQILISIREEADLALCEGCGRATGFRAGYGSSAVGQSICLETLGSDTALRQSTTSYCALPYCRVSHMTSLNCLFELVWFSLLGNC